ncbi:hypothetical protein CCHL11_04181 [Colletotrichum chlorophyti]|uniref:Adhesin domain-containing protein n=1 Tax=Colletotrichum chlorophyti TaxID=708187 RepID=A0A1Q8RPP3_9PEZI|nr:hypothetical protein CCHL11_04181 [Colletotrichum chlorophyti]
MPAPYSDNLYSAADDSDFDEVSSNDNDNDLDVHLSPTDGYFQSSTTSSAGGIYPPQQQDYYHNQDDVTDATFPTSAGVPHVPNVFVQDPSLQQTSSSKKDREASEETRLNSSAAPQRTSSPAAAVDDYYDGASSIADSVATPSHTTYTSHAQSSSSYTPYSPSTDAPLRTPRTHPGRSLYSYPASLFRIPREAPPAYTPSPTSPLSSSSEHRNYQTFGTAMGSPEEERRLLGRDPESMGDEPYDDTYPRPLPWKDRAAKKFSWVSRRTLKMTLFAALIFFTVSGFLSILTTTVTHMPSDKSPSKEPAKDFDPVTGLPIKDGPSVPDEPSRPGGSPSLPWNPASDCLPTQHRFEPRIFDLSFTPDKSLTLLQTFERDSPPHGYQPHMFGELVVRRQQAGSPGPSIELEVVANDEALDVGVEWDSASQHLNIKTLQRIEWYKSLRPCIYVRATVWVPENAQLKTAVFGAVNLGVKFADDLAITVKDGLEITAVSGDVYTPTKPPPSYRVNSRSIVVKTISGDIKGSWPLYDSLKISSDSGDIDALVNPQQVLDSLPLPAVLEVSSISGSVTVKEPLDEAAQTTKPDTVIPPRDYVTTIDTKSGAIHAWVAFSSVAVVNSISGDVAAEFLPVFNVSLLQSVTEPELHTKTKSGNVAVRVLEPVWVEIARTESRPVDDKPRVNPNEPVDIPTNPLPVPDIPSKIPRIPGLPTIPIGAGDPYQRIRFPGRRWKDLVPGTRSVGTEARSQGQERPPMRHLKSSHETISGNSKILYPGSWEGSVSAESISGKIVIGGKGVSVDSRSRWPQVVRGHKGQSSACSASLGSASGDETFIVGDTKA